MFTGTSNTRPRSSQLRYATIAIFVLCAIAYIIIWDDSELVLSPEGDMRRQLAFLDARPAPRHPYGRVNIDQNYQSLLQPSAIDSSLFRKKRKKKQGDDSKRDKGFADGESACDNVLLFLPHSFAHNGHASQLNNYLLAVMIATFTDRAMVILETPRALNKFNSNSQFGCPPDAWETKMVRTGGKPKKIGWKEDFPNGLSRLIKHPVWLSRQCPVPCQETHSYEDWDELRLKNNATDGSTDAPNEVVCTDSRRTNVVVMGGPQIRGHFWNHYKHLMIDRSPPLSLEAALSSQSALKMNYEWAMRLGAAPHEARIFSGLRDRQEIWDYASAFLGRSGIMRFQPWIGRDVEEFIASGELPLDAPYDAIHVRRGDKLESTGKHFVRKYWDERRKEMGWTEKLHDAVTRPAKNYIPFSEYLAQFDDAKCQLGEDEPRLVYVATDDPAEVRKEIEELPKDSEGNTLLAGDSCLKFRFIFSPFDQSLGFHINTGQAKLDCDARYARAVAGVADLMILAKSDMFVGEFSSNWGTLVRIFRLRMNDNDQLRMGESPVVERKMKIAWGRGRPGPPGW